MTFSLDFFLFFTSFETKHGVPDEAQCPSKLESRGSVRNASWDLFDIQQFDLNKKLRKLFPNNRLMTHDGTEHKQFTQSKLFFPNKTESFWFLSHWIVSRIDLLLPNLYVTPRDELLNKINENVSSHANTHVTLKNSHTMIHCYILFGFMKL